MKSNALMEALWSLKTRYRKNIIENRAMMILIWVQAAVMAGMFCSYLFIRTFTAYAIGQIDAHPHQPAATDIVGHTNLWQVCFWVLTIGLPAVALILGISGMLPGTYRRSVLAGRTET
ncbi:MAG TPA: hypothetical protein VMH87_20635 [Pseudomonadales bacterium]|nr:hypothetical protein [Pseudomonadales bacterium]